jgi:hypothetical protein
VERCTCKLKKDGMIYLRIWLPGRGLAESVSLVEIAFAGDAMRRLHIDLLLQNWIKEAREAAAQR